MVLLGTCDWASKKCTCSGGNFGTDCSFFCGDCDLHGSCGRTDGKCVCDPGWALSADGKSCDTETGCAVAENYCKQEPPNCDVKCGLQNSAGCTGVYSGECFCQKGWAGPNCDKTCPGIDADTNEGNECGGHGSCSVVTGTCTCDPCFEPNADGICVAKANPNCGPGEVVCNEATGNKECNCPGAFSGAGCSTCACQNSGTCNSITRGCGE